MNAAALLALLATSGCATTWVMSEAAGRPRIWDEGVHEVDVPQPGITERLTVTLPLYIEYAPTPAAVPGKPAPEPQPEPFALTCSTDQEGHDVVYHQAFRYGSLWKKVTAISFLVESAGATLAILAGDHKLDDQVAGGLLAADAAVTGALFFLPREEIYRHDDRQETTHVRSDCPDGLALAIDGTAYPVNAAGRLSDVGYAALEDWMKRAGPPIEVHLGGAIRSLPLGPDERCTWRREHDGTACTVTTHTRWVTAQILVPPGTLVTALTF